MIRLLLTAFLLSLATAGPPRTANAKDLFVNNVVGDDRRDGSSPMVVGTTGGPCRSIRRALQHAQSRDRIILAKTDQPYRESITLQAGQHSGSPTEPFELVGNGAILDGTQPIPLRAWEHVRDHLFRFSPSRLSYQMVYLGDRPAARRVPDREGGLPELQPLQWSLYERQVYFRTEDQKLPSDYPLAASNLTVGITLYDVHDVVIRDLIIQGFQLDGVNAHDNVFSGELRNLNCRGNGRSGVSIGGASRIQLVECLVVDNGSAQLRTEGHCKVELIRCELLDNTAPAVVRDGGQVFVSATPQTAPPTIP
jgi:hypothetical protein